jgi:hypothetical protein
MKKISSVVTNYDSATAGFSEGKLRDNPGDDTGSSVVAAIDNDAFYARLSIVTKYRPSGITDAAESELNSDFRDGLEHMAGIKVDAIDDWDAGTTYSVVDVSVMRYGLQFTNINSTSNTNKDPFTQPTFWMAVPDSRKLFNDFREGRVIVGQSHGLHDYNAAGYRQYFSLGTHVFGGVDGVTYNAWAVHLDGSAVGSGDLSTIVEAWAHKDSFAPGSVGARTLQDARGKVLRAIDATGGQADLIGEVLADQMQGHKHVGIVSPAGAGTLFGSTGASYSLNDTTSSPITDGTNGTPRTGSTTRDKSITVGVPYVVIMVAA